MKILLVQVIYNEIKLLPWKLKWAEENGLEVFTFDNYSDDGTWEWLKEHRAKGRAPSRMERLDTDGIFSLKLNNRAILKKFHELKPDWCVIAGCDMFYRLLDYPEMKLNQFIATVDKLGYNLVDCSRLFNFYYTGGEDDSKNPLIEYRYYKEQQDWEICLIAKYDKSLWIDGDQFRVDHPNMFHYPEFVCLHYWFRSDARERFVKKWQRRFQSWEKGLDNKDHGGHYPGIVREDRWVVEKEELMRLDV